MRCGWAVAGEGGEVQVRRAMCCSYTNRSDHRAARYEQIALGCHNAVHVRIHGVEAGAMIENQRAALARPRPDPPIGGGASRRAARAAIGVDQIERIAIPAIVATAAIAL